MPRTSWIAFLLVPAGLLSAQTSALNPIEGWVTNLDRSALFQKLPEAVPFRSGGGRGAAIVIDTSLRMQTIDGFGFALTGGSAELLHRMTAEARGRILKQVFATDGE